MPIFEGGEGSGTARKKAEANSSKSVGRQSG